MRSILLALLLVSSVHAQEQFLDSQVNGLAESDEINVLLSVNAPAEANADVTDEDNVKAALNGATLTELGSVAAGDLVLLQDVSDSSILKVVQATNLGGGGGGFGGGFDSAQIFTSSGTWTRPSGITKVLIFVQGAGGGGGGGDATAGGQDGGSGGSGGYSLKILDVGSIASSTITIGAGGAGGTTSTNGSAGGTSSWDDGTNTITANGGSGGIAGDGTATWAAGGTASGGDINITGMSGGWQANTSAAPFTGGHSFYGHGGQSQVGGPSGIGGEDGIGYGAGGGGGQGDGTTTEETGGDGAGGIVVVYEYISAAGSTLTQEEVEDYAGAMATGNTETRITVTYQDGDGTIDYVVDDDLANYDNTTSGFIADYTVTEGDVTAHESALTITESQISDLSHTTDTNLTQEEVEDFAGAMWTGNTETGITITYQDGTGDIDAVVADTTVAGDTGSTGITPGDTLTIAGGTNVTTSMSGDTLTINASGGSSIAVEDEGVELTSAVTVIDCVGSGITCTEPSADEIQISISAGSAPVDSVNGQTGVVVLDADDIDDTSTAHKYVTASDLTTLSNTSGTNTGDQTTITGNAGTATALASNGANCSAGNYPLGVDASGAVESCTADSDTQLSQEQVEDFAGGMVTGNTETGITVTYQDGDGTVDYVVSVNNGQWSGTDLSVSNGGTGASTLTDGGVLLGSGTGAITPMGVLADGAMIVGDGTTDPVAESGATLRSSIGVDAAGTDNSTNVTLAGTPDYITISGQEITRGTVDIGDDTNLAAGRSLTLTGDSVAADAELYTDLKEIVIPDPATTDSGDAQLMFPTAVTVTRVACSTDTGTATIQFDERGATTPNTGGTDVMTSQLVCDSDEQDTTSFSNSGIASRVPMNLDIDAVASDPTVVRIFVEYTVND